MGNTFSQFYFIPAPTVTEKNCPDQAGRVHLVTGGYGGVGFELCKILYQHNATVYLAGRSNSKAQTAIQSLRSLYPDSRGRAEFLELDLSDLPTLKPAVTHFLSQQDKLHVLTLNAGVGIYTPLLLVELLSGVLIVININHQVMNTPKGARTAQGHEMQIGTNCLGSHLLYLLLRPTLLTTAHTNPPGSVRVTWAGSVAIDVASHKPGGMLFSPPTADSPVLAPDTSIHPHNLYAASKTGNLYLAAVNGRRDAQGPVLHVCWNPGNLRTDLSRHNSKLLNLALAILMNPPVLGAYTELFAAVGEIFMGQTGSYIAPWGRRLGVREDVEDGCRPESEGGLGSADKFVAWCDGIVAGYV